MSYLLHTDDERRQMLAAIGVGKMSDLFTDIPMGIRSPALDIPGPLSETEIRNELNRLAALNSGSSCSIFLGAGSYNHFSPAALPYIVKRSEFYTAYTPYQPEISQGMLQAIFEYQTMMCELTGLDASNASMYDGATAMYEAAIMSMRATKMRMRVLIDEGVSPIYRRVLGSYAGNLDFDFVTVPHKNGRTDVEAIKAKLGPEIACVIVSNPNFFGIVQDFTALSEAVHAAGALLVMSVNPIAAAIVKSAATMGADIALGEGQPLGSPMFFGGPYIGFLTVKEAFVRTMPGRIISETVDRDGKRGFVMTLQTREQHIRREKATSNICSNQGLIALTASVFLSLMGKRGLVEMAQQNVAKAEYAKGVLTALKGVALKFHEPTFNEFVITLPDRAEGTLKRLAVENKIIGGLALGKYFTGMDRDVLVCVTEMNSKGAIDAYAAALGRLL
ncbi:MAG: aminomethyl-transferring glycine dehydrogenase subunit GcvPA [Candidatus Brocadiia bacterium]